MLIEPIVTAPVGNPSRGNGRVSASVTSRRTSSMTNATPMVATTKANSGALRLRSAAITVLLRATEISTPTRTPIAIAGRTGMSASSANQVEKAPHVRI